MAPAPNSASYSCSNWTWEENQGEKKPRVCSQQNPCTTQLVWIRNMCVFHTRYHRDKVSLGTSVSRAAPCWPNQLLLAQRNSRTAAREVGTELYQKSDSIYSSKSSRDRVQRTGLAARHGHRAQQELMHKPKAAIPAKNVLQELSIYEKAAAALVRVRSILKSSFSATFSPKSSFSMISQALCSSLSLLYSPSSVLCSQAKQAGPSPCR